MRRSVEEGPALLGPLTLSLALLSCPALAQDEDCLQCHARESGMLASGDLEALRPLDELLVDPDLFGRSVHGGKVGCTDCHPGREQFPHPLDGASVSCATCHADEAAVLAASVHGASRPGEPRLPVACEACHGTHDVLPPSDRDSHLHPLNVYRACGQCHFGVDARTATVEQLMAEPYTDDVHGEGILRAGLVVSATCVSCHGGHAIAAKGDPASPVSRENVDRTCGQCHVGVAEEYRRSVHFVKGGGEGHAGATCSDCHKPHEIALPNAAFMIGTNQTCTGCHKERAGSFRQTYHGKITTLGFEGKVATCAACHGNHAILPEADPASTVNPANRVRTCSQCHADAQAEFATYLVHADPTDGEKFPQLHLAWTVMNGLLLGTLALGGLHALLWLVRATADGQWRRHRGNGLWLRRWPTSYVVFHGWMVGSVLLLASTGLPLHYSDQPWAGRLMHLFGGPVAAGWVHRVAAVGLGALFAAYLGNLAWRFSVRRERGLFSGPDTMLPRWKDVQDLGGTLRWFLFLAPRPRYDRWTYWEKFDFWAAFWGLFVIGVSGLMLWFPERATLLLPGWSLNVAVIIHGIEALLDIAFIFTVHAFHANLRPDKFPMDTAFLTGRIPEHEFAADRPLEYERLQRAGTLDALRVDPPTRRLRLTAYVLGGCALAVGFFFVAMMIVAVVRAG